MISVIIQKDDIKSKKWAQAAYSLGINIVQQKGSPIRAPFFLFNYLLKNKKPKAYILRYLNDYPSFIKTLIRTLSEITVIGICLILRIKIFWICHNVDKDSIRNFPRISSFRRKMIATLVKKIFVTDSLLAQSAKEILPKYGHKIDYISFGEIEGFEKGAGDNESIKFLNERKEYATQNGHHFFAVLCAGAPDAPKSLHFHYLIKLIEDAKKNNLYLAVLVAGNWNSSISRKLLATFQHNSNILIFEKYTTFSSGFIKNNIDFYFRGYDDYSVPFTIYEACTLQKPILALDIGFLPRMIEFYELGVVTKENFIDIDKSLHKLSQPSKFKFKEFLEEKKWSGLGEKLVQHINE